MTKLTATPVGKGLKRLIPRPIMGREWIVELDSVDLRIRQKGSRTTFTLPWEFCVNAAANRTAEKEMQERRARRKRGETK